MSYFGYSGMEEKQMFKGFINAPIAGLWLGIIKAGFTSEPCCGEVEK